MTTNEMRADVKKLLKRVDEDAKGTRCLTMAEVTLCLDELRRLATPSVASPQAAWKDDALQSRINEAVDEANGVTAAPVASPQCTCGADRTGPSAEAHDSGCPATAPVGEPGRTPPSTVTAEQVKEAYSVLLKFAETAMDPIGFAEWLRADRLAAAPPAQGAPGTREHEIQGFACKNCGLVASLCKYHTRCLAALAQPGAPTKEGTCKEKLFS
jgi:hypothetical protein